MPTYLLTYVPEFWPSLLSDSLDPGSISVNSSSIISDSKKILVYQALIGKSKS